MIQAMPAIQLVPTVDQADHAAGTEYYPSSDGIPTDEFNVFTVGITAEDCTISVEQSIDGSTWIDITDYLIDIGGGFVGGPTVFAGSDDVQWLALLMYPDFIRIKVVYPNDTNATSVMFGRRSL